MFNTLASMVGLELWFPLHQIFLSILPCLCSNFFWLWAHSPVVTLFKVLIPENGDKGAGEQKAL